MAINKTLQVDLGGLDILCNSIVTSTPKQGLGTKLLTGNGLTPTSNTTTSLTVTAAMLLIGILVSNGASGVTATLDTAANIIAAVNNSTSGATIGDIIALEILANTSAVTIAAGTGGTFDANIVAGAKVIAINSAGTVFVRLTNVTPGAEAYVIYI